ncbi:hypothetical protein VP01_2890g2 [Puccinia sorghi]|uniref:Uncharacterized protein n=1 Tax=Puccinia sorghi TaxID=27349 RepID=A0A0L6V1J6_9BASI|nr:hypothetical protein VP01_2890g2 [Puccinia sorghi]
MQSEQKSAWSSDFNDELENIKGNDVWEDQFEEPKSHLKTVQIFKTKPSTLSSAECKKACLCTQVFLQIPDAFEKLFLKHFPNSTAHNPETLLGMELSYDSESVSLSQRKLIDKGLELAGIQECQTQPDLVPAVSILPDLSDTCNTIKHYTNATWADDLQTQFWKAFPVSWNSKKQRNITLSSTEAEMNSFSDKLKPTQFQIYNKGLIDKINNFGSNSKTKHLDIKAKWLCNLKNNNESCVKLIPSKEMVPDALTRRYLTPLTLFNPISTLLMLNFLITSVDSKTTVNNSTANQTNLLLSLIVLCPFTISCPASLSCHLFHIFHTSTVIIFLMLLVHQFLFFNDSDLIELMDGKKGHILTTYHLDSNPNQFFFFIFRSTAALRLKFHQVQHEATELMHDCPKTSTYANRWSLDDSLAGACCMSTAGS